MGRASTDGLPRTPVMGPGRVVTSTAQETAAMWWAPVDSRH